MGDLSGEPPRLNFATEIKAAASLVGTAAEGELLGRVERILSDAGGLDSRNRFALLGLAERALREGPSSAGNAIVAVLGEAQAYSRLADFVRANADDPLRAALAINGWQWTSLFPGGRAGKIENVANTLMANCGMRDWLFRELFKPIGVKHRRVNFYDVPVQVGHSTTELLLPTDDGPRWMWFDPTFGIYARIGSGLRPASIAEVFAHWPDVDFYHCHLPGWRGLWIDPEAVNPDDCYVPYENQFFYFPEDFRGARYVVSGERYSLYFGPKVYYFYPSGVNVPVPRLGWSWNIEKNTDPEIPWTELTTTYDPRGAAITQYAHCTGTDCAYGHYFADLGNADGFAWQKAEWYVRSKPPRTIGYKRITEPDGKVLESEAVNPSSIDERDPFLMARRSIGASHCDVAGLGRRLASHLAEDDRHAARSLLDQVIETAQGSLSDRALLFSALLARIGLVLDNGAPNETLWEDVNHLVDMPRLSPLELEQLFQCLRRVNGIPSDIVSKLAELAASAKQLGWQIGSAPVT